MSSSKSSNDSNQQVVTTQNTNVNVQNIIEAPKPSALEQFKSLADVVAVLDGGEVAKTSAAPTAAVVIQAPDSLAFLKDPQTLIWIAAGAIGLILIAKKA